MDLKIFFLSFFSILFSMVILDAVWLGLTLKSFYQPNLAHLMGDSPKLFPVAIFYLLYSFALAIFVVVPGIQNGTAVGMTFLLGLLFGLAAYGTYDLTNQAILRSWPTVVTFVDMGWGALLTGMVSLISVIVAKKIL